MTAIEDSLNFGLNFATTAAITGISLRAIDNIADLGYRRPRRKRIR